MQMEATSSLDFLAVPRGTCSVGAYIANVFGNSKEPTFQNPSNHHASLLSTFLSALKGEPLGIPSLASTYAIQGELHSREELILTQS